jgi:hypothetical protein
MDKNTGDYQLVRGKNNTYVNQSDMGLLGYNLMFLLLYHSVYL